VPASITGTARVGSTLTCDKGTWSDNTVDFDLYWSSPSRISGERSTSVLVTNEDAGQTFTCRVFGKSRTAQLLVERQADINHPGWTPLHYAATNGNPKIIKLLLEESAYIDAESPNGTTPLMMAARYGSTEAVHLLINEDANIHLKNQLGLNALNFAKDGGRMNAIKLIEAAMANAATPVSR
jgi:ankyrin repeat protein